MTELTPACRKNSQKDFDWLWASSGSRKVSDFLLSSLMYMGPLIRRTQNSLCTSKAAISASIFTVNVENPWTVCIQVVSRLQATGKCCDDESTITFIQYSICHLLLSEKLEETF